MEEAKKITCKQDKKKMKINIGGGVGVIGGVVLFGGALATATFAIRRIRLRRRRRPSTDDNNQSPPSIPLNLDEKEKNNKDEIGKGLCFLLPDFSPPILHHPSSNGTAEMGSVTQIESTSLVSNIQISILDEKPKLEFNGAKVDTANCHEEILFSEIPEKPEKSPWFDDSGIIGTEELSLPVFDSQLVLRPENVNKNESSEEIEAIDVAAQADQNAVEDNAPRQLKIVEDEKCNDDAKFFTEICGEVFEAAQDAVEMQLNEESDNSIPESSSFENYGVNKEEFCLPLSNIRKSLWIETVQVMKGDEGIEAAQGEMITVEDNPQKLLIEEQKKEDYDEDDGEIRASLPEPENVNKNDSPESPISIEAVNLMNDDGTMEADCADQIAVEDNLQMQLIDKEDNGDNDGRESIVVKGDEAVVIVQKDVVAADNPKQMQLSEGEEEVEIDHADQIPVEDDQQVQSTEVHETLVNGDQENCCSKKWIEESSPIENYGVYVHEFSLPVPDNGFLPEPECVNKNDSIEAPLSIEIFNLMIEEEAIEEVAHADQIALEDKPLMHLIEKEDYDDDDGRENIVVKGEEAVETVEADMVAVDYPQQMQLSEEEDIADKVKESSEGTGVSSMESNAEAICPAESMQELSLEFKESNNNKQKSGGRDIEEDGIVKTEEDSCHNSTENGKMDEERAKLTVTFSDRFMMKLATQNDQPPNSLIQRIWMWSMLVPMWCLCYWHFGLPFVKLCLVIIFSSVILFKFHEF